MTLVLIDDQGEVWDGSSRKLREAFDSPRSGGEFVDYAVMNLGFIAANIYRNSCQLRLRPDFIGDHAFRGLRKWLRSTPFDRLMISWFQKEWTFELLSAGGAALVRIETLLATARAQQPSQFLSQPRTAAALKSDSPVFQIVTDWQHLVQPGARNALNDLLGKAFGERHVIVKHDAPGAGIVFHSIGRDLFSEYDTWRTCAVGAPVDELPDRVYGRWISKVYADVLREEKPRIEDVDAIVRWPHAGRTRMRYKRVLLPVQTSEGQLLVCGSILDNAIDLRVAAG